METTAHVARRTPRVQRFALNQLKVPLVNKVFDVGVYDFLVGSGRVAHRDRISRLVDATYDPIEDIDHTHNLVNWRGSWYCMISCDTPMVQYVEFDAYLKYAYPPVCFAGAEIPFKKEMWETYFKLPAPEVVCCYSTAMLRLPVELHAYLDAARAMFIPDREFGVNEYLAAYFANNDQPGLAQEVFRRCGVKLIIDGKEQDDLGDEIGKPRVTFYSQGDTRGKHYGEIVHMSNLYEQKVTDNWNPQLEAHAKYHGQLSEDFEPGRFR